MPRVCHIIGSFRPVIGGAERTTETLASSLGREGVDVAVVTRRLAAADPPFEAISGVPVYRLGVPGRSKWHAFTFGLAAIFALMTRFRRYRVLHVQDIDVAMLVGILVRLLSDRSLVTTVHGEWPLISRSRSWSGRLRIRAMVRSTDRFTSLNPENTRQLVLAGASRSDIREIPNGIDEFIYRPPSERERNEARTALELPHDVFVAVYIGRLEPYKRVDLLLDAWSRLPADHRGRLVIVGRGSEAGRLKKLAAGSGSIRFDGPTDDAATYLRAADAFVNPSGDPGRNWYEGLSVALLEAMFSGVLPIVTSGPGNDVIVKDRVTGLSFPVGDVDALVGLLSLAMNDNEVRSRLARQARDSVTNGYSAAAVARKVAAVYREVAI